MNEPLVVQPLDQESYASTDSMNDELFRCGISDDIVGRSRMNEETAGVEERRLCGGGIQAQSCNIIFSSANFRTQPVQISPMSVKETDTASDAFLAEFSLQMQPDLLSARRSGPSIRRKQRPNPLSFSTSTGSQDAPFPSGSTESSRAVSAVEAVFDMNTPHRTTQDNSVASSTFSPTNTLVAPPTQPSPRKRKSLDTSCRSQVEDTLMPPFDQVSTGRPYSPGPGLHHAVGSPSSYPIHQPLSGPHDVPTESPQDWLQEDFIGMPIEPVADVPSDNALVMPPGIPDGILMDSPSCYPSESPTRVAPVIDVGLPTDFIIGLPSIADMPGDPAIGMMPTNTKSRPKSAGRNSVKEAPARKAKVPYPRAHSLPNTLEAQYWRQPTSRRFYPQGQGPPPPPPIPSLKNITDPFNPLVSQRLQGIKTRPDSRQYRRGRGLAPMPYSHPLIQTQTQSRPITKAKNTRRFSIPADYHSPPHPWQK